MNKIGLIVGREYLTRVRKKSFLITTIAVPLVMVGFYAVILMIAFKGSSDQQKIAVIDKAGIFSDSLFASSKKESIQYDLIKSADADAISTGYKDKGYDAVLQIPQLDIDNPTGIVIHSQSSLSLTTTSRIENMVDNVILDKRLQIQGIDPESYKKLNASVNIENTIDTKDGSKKSVAGVAYAVSFACGMLIYIMMIIYGAQVMRGVMEEKTNRIAEVVVSSVKPFQLMMGKILGIGAVGLTQFSIWIVLTVLAQAVVPLIFPELMQKMNSVSPEETTSMAATITQGISSLPLLKIGLSFMFYFIGGYLTYASLFAAVGSVVSEDQQEAQQLMFPILMPIILGFVIMMQAVNVPHSTLAIFGSIFPLTSPIVMMGRITYDIPVWQMATSMILLIACFLFFTWVTAKIYRTGILMYGKKPSWKEMLKWGFRKG